MLSFSGSLPSLVGAVWTTTKNLPPSRVPKRMCATGCDGAVRAAVPTDLGPLAAGFREELAAMRQERQ